MKKVLFLCLFVIAACEVRTAPVKATVVVEPQVCAPTSSDVYWASYCDGSCCYEEYWSGPWICEEAWCYDYYYCSWEYMGDTCY
jgi:hypothetical protein